MADKEKIIPIHEESKGEKFIIKIFKHRNTIFSGVCILFAMAVVAIRFLPNKGKKMEEYAKANASFNSWNNSHEFSEILLSDLTQAIKLHPELANKYNTSIYQKFVALGKGKDISEEALQEINRTSFMGHYYTHFSKNTLEIADQNYQEALEMALNLKARMQEDQTFMSNGYEGGVLYAFNLIRIANLQQKLGQVSLERDAWKEVKVYLFEENNNWQPKDEFVDFTNHFVNKKVSLIDYIQARETILSND